MAKLITFAEAVARFGPVVTTGIDVESAIQEAVDRIFEMGRHPGTTEEIELVESDFIEDPETGDWFVFFEETDYDGAIGFRSRHRGWSIVDQSALYKDGINAGDGEFVDMGTILQADGTERRKYRCPQGWAPDQGPYYALLKKEAPVLASDDLIPVQSVGALKAAIQAVCYEYVADEQRSQLKWSEFDAFMKMSGKQVSGPKKYFIGMDSSLKRKPRQFM
jgi:hypothetical protein